MKTANPHALHECPECDRPLRGATTCPRCGWINEAARAAANDEGGRQRCACVTAGKRCARPGTIARGASLNPTYYCAQHYASVYGRHASHAMHAPPAPSPQGPRHLCAYVAGGVRCRNVGTVSRAVGAGVAFLCPAHHRCRTETEAAAIVERSLATQ